MQHMVRKCKSTRDSHRFTPAFIYLYRSPAAAPFILPFLSSPPHLSIFPSSVPVSFVSLPSLYPYDIDSKVAVLLTAAATLLNISGSVSVAVCRGRGGGGGEGEGGFAQSLCNYR